MAKKPSTKKIQPAKQPETPKEDPVLKGLGEIAQSLQTLGQRVQQLEEGHKKPFSTEEFSREQAAEANARRKVTPASKRFQHAVDSADAQVGQDAIITFNQNPNPYDAETDAELNRPEVKVVQDIDPKTLQAIAFYEQMCVVYVADTSEKNADPVFTIGVNGINYMFIRGRRYRLPRYVVEGLARAKPISYKNEEYTTPDGRRDYRYPSKTGVRYNFNVEEDPSGAVGEMWLRNVLAQV